MDQMAALCRVCIEKAAECTLLNTQIQNSSNLTFFDFLNKCSASLNARENDKLPQSLCSTCTHSIKTFYSFVKLAEKSNIILRKALKKSIATAKYNDSREFSCEEIIIANCKIEKESEDCNKEDSFHCETSTNATGSSVYILDIVKEEPRISESTSIVAKINESDEFRSNLDHPEGSMEEPDDILSCLAGHLANIHGEHSGSEEEDDVPISSLKRRLVTNKETDSQKTKIDFEGHIRIELGCRNQVSSEATPDSLELHLHEYTENSYKCIECDLVFNEKEEFRAHCRNHVCGDKHECNICGKKFAKRAYLLRHLEIHNEEKGYKCSICGKDFKHASSHRNHMRIHISGKTFACELCSKTFTKKCNLKDHVEIHKGIIKKCGQCDKEFKNTRGLRTHMKWHTNPFKCENCGRLFGRKYTYTYHMAICKHAGNSNEETHREGHTENTCKECDITFNDKEEFERHCRNHLNGVIHDKKKYKCSICGRGYKYPSNRRRHMRIHSDPRPPLLKLFECDICSKKFKEKCNLKQHMDSHNGITKKCEQCGKELKNSQSLRCHMKRHINPKPFKCENCGKSLSRKSRYIRHMEICKPIGNSNEETHREGHTEKVYKCSICRKSFKYFANLYKHMRIHSDRKSFACEICSKKFGRIDLLKRHIERHKGVIKKCDQCGKEFKNSDTLWKHMKWHFNPTPFKCENCGKSLVWKQNFARHMEICKPISNLNDVTVTIEESSFQSKGN